MVLDVSSYVSGGLELKPVMRNGHAKSRSGSVLSNLSNGTGTTSNGVLKNKVSSHLSSQFSFRFNWCI